MKTFALIDCNNFFVSCERVFNPTLKDKPVVVLSSNDGCVISRSNEIKEMGVPMGIPYFKMKEIYDLSDVRIFSTNFRLYKDMSLRVMNIIKESCSFVETYSIDESFIDISNEVNPKYFCLKLQRKILKYTGIPVSIGVSSTKTLAKIANRIAKDTKEPVYILMEKERVNILKDLSVSKVWGVGAGLFRSFNRLSIKSAYDLISKEESWIKKNFGINLLKLVSELKGISCLSLQESTKARKTIISSRSFGQKVKDLNTIKESISYHVRSASRQMREEGSATSCISVYLRSGRFGHVSKSLTFEVPVSDVITLTKRANELIESIYIKGYEYTKSGIVLSHFCDKEYVPQKTLFNEEVFENDSLMKAIDGLNSKYGSEIIKLGSYGKDNLWKPKSLYISKEYTTNWNGIIKIKKALT